MRLTRHRRVPLPCSPSAIAIAVALALGATGCASAAATRHANEAPALQPFQIRTAQRALSNRGLHVPTTGELDEATRSALARFQASKGLPTTGELTFATARELGVSLDPMYDCELNTTVDCGPAPN